MHSLTSCFVAFQEEARRAQMAALKEALKDTSEADRRRIISEFEASVYGVKAELKDQRGAQRDKLLAKLEARRRMMEEVTKETTVTKEMERITQSQVCVFISYALE